MGSLTDLPVRFRKNSFLIFILLIVFSLPSNSQNITGNLSGHITDTTGASLSGVNVTITSSALQGIRGSATRSNGFFRIILLPPGIYSLKISAVGYTSMTIKSVEVLIGSTTDIGDVELTPQAIDLPEIDIAAASTLIDPVSTTYGGNISSSDFEQLPVNRNYKELITLLPQANLSYYGDQVNLGGATGHENKYYVDGVEVTDPLIGADGTNLPYNFIQQIEVKTGGYGAESRSALGGLLNVITHSGTNNFHGSIFGFYTSNRMMENRRFGLLDVNQGDFTSFDVGFGIAGPIIADKLWFYSAYNPTINRRDVVVPGYGIHIDKTLMHSFAVKLNWRALENFDVAFTATGDPAKRDAVGRDVSAGFVYNPDPYLQNIYEGGINLSLNGIYRINENLTLQGTISRIDRHDTGEPSTEKGKELLFTDVPEFSASGGVGSRWDSYRHSTVGKISGTLLSGNHLLKAGVEYKINSVDNFYDGHIITKVYLDYYEEIFKGSGVVYNQVPSVFVQDLWYIDPRLSINAGLRWDGQYITGSNNKIVQTIINPLQPRLGFVYLPSGINSHRIFGSFGRYSQEFALFQSVNYHSENAIYYVSYYDHDPRVDPSGGVILFKNSQNISPETEGLRGQYFDEFNLGYEIILGWNIRAGIQGVYRILREAIDDAYLPSEERSLLGNPGRGILSEWPKAQRDYKALVFTIERRLDDKFNFHLSYVLSRDYGNYEGLYNAIQHDPFPNSNLAFDNLESSRINTTGVLPNDRTHVFKVSGYYLFPFALTAGLSFVAQSGTPLTDFFVSDNEELNFITPRGSAGKTPAIWDLNARLTYSVPFLSWNTKLILDAFHIASQRKAVDIVQVKYHRTDPEGNPLDNPFYKKVFRYQSSMSLRLGFEINF